MYDLLLDDLVRRAPLRAQGYRQRVELTTTRRVTRSATLIGYQWLCIPATANGNTRHGRIPLARTGEARPMSEVNMTTTQPVHDAAVGTSRAG